MRYRMELNQLTPTSVRAELVEALPFLRAFDEVEERPFDKLRAIGGWTVRITLLAMLLALAACSTITEPRVRSALRDAGLSERMAACMAERMVDKLSIAQLRRLQSLANVGKRNVRSMSLDAFLFEVRALKDPEIFAVTSRAGRACAIGG